MYNNRQIVYILIYKRALQKSFKKDLYKRILHKFANVEVVAKLEMKIKLMNIAIKKYIKLFIKIKRESDTCDKHTGGKSGNQANKCEDKNQEMNKEQSIRVCNEIEAQKVLKAHCSKPTYW